ncbi:MAG: hypothetical protein ACK2UB_15265, partial [Anaerolineales bacterium]
VSFGLLAMFFLAISPWHIMMSRWGINENILPFLFLMAFTAILASTKHNGWFLAGSFLLGLCLYAYGASYVAVPIFLLCAIPLLLRYQAVSVRTAVLGVCIFCFVSIPIVLFLLVNTLRLPPLSIGPLTIPRLPMQPRYEFMGAMFSSASFAALKENFQTAVRLIMGEPDGLAWNAVPPYQYFYPGAYILSLLGAVLLLPSRVGEDGKTKGLMLAWLFAAFCIGLAQPANINRLHLLFIPLIFCAAIAVYFCFQYLRPFSYALIVPFLAGFLLFNGAYHGSEFRLLIGKEFFHGLIPALEFARSFDHQPICVTDTVNQPFVYVLFVEQWNPAAYTAPADTGREKPLLMDRYAFGPASCPALPEMIYIVSADEEFSAPGSYQEELFDNYIVYYPAEDG